MPNETRRTIADKTRPFDKKSFDELKPAKAWSDLFQTSGELETAFDRFKKTLDSRFGATPRTIICSGPTHDGKWLAEKVGPSPGTFRGLEITSVVHDELADLGRYSYTEPAKTSAREGTASESSKLPAWGDY